MHPHESFLGLVTLGQRAYTANEAPSVNQVPLPNAVILSFYKGGDDRLKITAFYCVPLVLMQLVGFIPMSWLGPIQVFLTQF